MQRDRMPLRRFLIGAATAALLGSAIGVVPATVLASGGNTRMISSSGTARFGAGTPGTGVLGPEYAGTAESDGDLGSDRSHSSGGQTPAGALSQPANVTNSSAELVTSFDGLNHFDQRFGTDAGNNQFSIEPPDQGLCVGSDGNGNTRVLEVINDVMTVFDASGHRVIAPATALNGFFGYAPAIDRTTGIQGAFVTDPSCLYDAATGHWFLDVLTIDVDPATSGYTGTNHLDLAVSNTADPTGTWTVYRIAVQDDGTDGTPNHDCSPASKPGSEVTNPSACFGDYPHIGSDANGIYLTTNEYSFFGPEFHGAQIYALSKAQLAALSPTVAMQQFDTHGLDSGFALNGFTVWPSVTPNGGGDGTSGGTEWFLSSNAGAEAHDTGDGTADSQASTELVIWALTNTSSLNGTPALNLSHVKRTVGVYAPPLPSVQKAGSQPLRECLNQNACSVALEGIKDPFAEKSASIDSSDSRMQQVSWVNGHLWGSLGTSLTISNGKQAGIEWFNVLADSSSGQAAATVAGQGYLGLNNANLTYPALGITSGGTGVMAFTVVGGSYYPSAGYATFTNAGPGAIHLAQAGAGPDDGFSNYALFGDPPGTTRPRWGDYGAAVAVGNQVWIASEYIGQSCTIAQYKASNFRCGNSRTALANWDTRISLIAAP